MGPEVTSQYARVAEVARSARIQVLTLAGPFAARGGDWRRWWATRYDPHPNPAAHRLAARAIAREIQARGLLGSDPARLRPATGQPRPERVVAR